MKTILILTGFAAILMACGGGGGNAGTCYPASVCGKSGSTSGSTATTYAEKSGTTGNPVPADTRQAMPQDSGATDTHN